MLQFKVFKPVEYVGSTSYVIAQVDFSGYSFDSHIIVYSKTLMYEAYAAISKFLDGSVQESILMVC